MGEVTNPDTTHMAQTILGLILMGLGTLVLSSPVWAQSFTPPPNSGAPSTTTGGGSRYTP